MLTFITILNTIAIAYLFWKQCKLYIAFTEDRTFIQNTLVAYHITLWKKVSEFSSSGVFTIVIPIKNKRKTELSEEVQRMIAKYDNQAKLQALSAMFSWLKTWDEVRQFQKDYEVVDRKIVENLVSNFIEKTNA